MIVFSSTGYTLFVEHEWNSAWRDRQDAEDHANEKYSDRFWVILDNEGLAVLKNTPAPKTFTAAHADACPDCRCLKVGHHPGGCEGAGGNCGCTNRFPDATAEINHRLSKKKGFSTWGPINQIADRMAGTAAWAAEQGFSEQDFIDAAATAFCRAR